MDLSVFEQLESEVRGYIRSFPVVFERAQGSVMVDAEGREYLDFFAGAGALNYGHNNALIKPSIIDYLAGDRILHALDMATTAKQRFLETFQRVILAPRGLDYRVQFTGPTGTNAVEAALKIARLSTGRSTVIAFTHSFHGLSAGALAATANRKFRNAAGIALDNVVFVPYEGYFGPDADTIAQLATLLDDPSSGLDAPAAVIVESIQAEGGINVASPAWLQALRELCTERGILLIVDDIQAGCGRSGEFFSFEASGIVPDLVTLSKSLSGYGLPMSVTLINPEHDVLKPGTHSGTFRGNNLAFVGAVAALEHYWQDDALSREVHRKSALITDRLGAIAARHPGEFAVRGRGLLLGLVGLRDRGLASRITDEAFRRGIIIETSGAYDEVVKFLPALTIDDAELARGLDAIEASVETAIAAAG